MRYYFQSFKAIPKRRKTVDDLVALLEIEKATRDAFDKNAEEAITTPKQCGLAIGNNGSSIVVLGQQE